MALCILDVAVDPPSWWLGAHPEERAGWGAGTDPAPAVVSWASHRWRTEAGNALVRLLTTLQGSSYGGAVAGVQISAGVAGEWRHPHPDRMPDTGACMTAQFRAYALEKYRRNGGVLRKAWGDAHADFRTLDCPGAFERQRGRYGILRDPERSRRVLDHLDCCFHEQVAAALHFCRLVKTGASDALLVGLSWPAGFQPSAHSSDGNALVEPIVGSPYVDFLANAGSEAGEDVLRGPVSGVRLHGKLYFHRPMPFRPPAESAALARSWGAGIIVAGTLSAESAAAVRTIAEAGAATSGPTDARRQVAVVIDPAASLYLGDGQSLDWLQRAQAPAMLAALGECGVPADAYAISDLFLSNLPKYRVWVFPNALYLSEAERRTLDARVKQNEQFALWTWAPGLIGETGVGAELAQRCSGQRLRAEPDASEMKVRIAVSGDPFTWGFHQGAAFGAGPAVAPTITVPDKASRRLGANGANKTAFAVREHAAWTSVVFGAAPVPTALLRNALKSAGCHIWTERGSGVYPILDLLAVFPRGGGPVRISLPGPHDVYDAVSGNSLGDAISDLTVELSNGPRLLLLRARPKPQTSETEQDAPRPAKPPRTVSRRR
jgi:hypothetical protein